MPNKNILKSFIDIDKISKVDLYKIIDCAKKLKNGSIKNQEKLLSQKTLAMIFEKTSTRTRVSFEVAINHLGGKAIVMNKNDTQIGKGETIEDTAKVISSYVDLIMIRSNSHQTIIDLAKNSSVPVINGLSDFSHPCQILASILAIEEKIGKISGKKIAWLGDQNNVLNSYIQAAKIFNYELNISSPKEIIFSNKEISKAKKNGAKINYYQDPKIAVKNADVIVTDTWFSMGDAGEKNVKIRNQKIKILKPYQVNSSLIKLANKNVIFTHCLPVYRGYEATAEVVDSKYSIIFLEAQNRLHVQKAILLWLMNKI